MSFCVNRRRKRGARALAHEARARRATGGNLTFDEARQPLPMAHVAMAQGVAQLEWSPETLACKLPVSGLNYPPEPGLHAARRREFEGCTVFWPTVCRTPGGAFVTRRRLAKLGVRIDDLSPLDRPALVGRQGRGATTFRQAARVKRGRGRSGCRRGRHRLGGMARFCAGRRRQHGVQSRHHPGSQRRRRELFGCRLRSAEANAVARRRPRRALDVRHRLAVGATHGSSLVPLLPG